MFPIFIPTNNSSGGGGRISDAMIVTILLLIIELVCVVAIPIAGWIFGYIDSWLDRFGVGWITAASVGVPVLTLIVGMAVDFILFVREDNKLADAIAREKRGEKVDWYHWGGK